MHRCAFFSLYFSFFFRIGYVYMTHGIFCLFFSRSHFLLACLCALSRELMYMLVHDYTKTTILSISYLRKYTVFFTIFLHTTLTHTHTYWERMKQQCNDKYFFDTMKSVRFFVGLFVVFFLPVCLLNVPLNIIKNRMLYMCYIYARMRFCNDGFLLKEKSTQFLIYFVDPRWTTENKCIEWTFHYILWTTLKCSHFNSFIC